MVYSLRRSFDDYYSVHRACITRTSKYKTTIIIVMRPSIDRIRCNLFRTNTHLWVLNNINCIKYKPYWFCIDCDSFQLVISEQYTRLYSVILCLQFKYNGAVKNVERQTIIKNRISDKTQLTRTYIWAEFRCGSCRK